MSTTLSTVSFGAVENMDVAQYEGVNEGKVDDTIYVTSEMVSRFYNAMYMIRQMYANQLDLPETAILMQELANRIIVEALGEQFPLFKNAKFNITNGGRTITGGNETANAILSLIQRIQHTPVANANPESELKQVETALAALDQGPGDDEDWDDSEEDYEDGARDW